jgi:molecular chaperone DnaJ
MGNLGDIFGDFFGGGMGRSSRQRKGRDVQTEITLTFEEAIFGVAKVIKINKQTVCGLCNGSGAKVGTNLKTCPTCDGQGQVREVKRSILGNFETRKMCETCFGKGKVPNEKCSQCKGAGVHRKDENITLNIPSGINNGETLRVHGMGEAIQGGGTGDLYVKLNVNPHHIYTRENSNLLTNIDIKLTDALLGKSYDLEILEGKTVEVKIPEGINNGDLLRVKGKGVPTGHSRGDIIIKVHIKMPSKLSRKNKDLIEKLKEEGL